MKVTLSEINKNLRGTNNVVNEVKTQINDLELKEEKRSTQNSKKKKESKKTRIGLGTSGTSLDIRTSK